MKVFECAPGDRYEFVHVGFVLELEDTDYGRDLVKVVNMLDENNLDWRNGRKDGVNENGKIS